MVISWKDPGKDTTLVVPILCDLPGGRCLPEDGFWLMVAQRRNLSQQNWRWWVFHTSGQQNQPGSGRLAHCAQQCTEPHSGIHSYHKGWSAAEPSVEDFHRRVHFNGKRKKKHLRLSPSHSTQEAFSRLEIQAFVQYSESLRFAHWMALWPPVLQITCMKIK